MPLFEVDDEQTGAMSKWRPTNPKALKADMITVPSKVGAIIAKEMGNLFGIMFNGWSRGYPIMGEYLKYNSKIVHSTSFETEVVKVCCGGRLTPGEVAVLKGFVRPRGAGTLAATRKRKKRVDDYASQIIR
ncbi:hypothetical protein L916_20806 [Phytophthora nicotianae]|uniref:Uncharacterized protein n=1 Tax=Phytophthora nicotianae TaxID=4792 RepID=W2HTL9_PHYNI|nr:hypothetical protein L916_20806 [Phytophthora nicotianae]